MFVGLNTPGAVNVTSNRSSSQLVNAEGLRMWHIKEKKEKKSGLTVEKTAKFLMWKTDNQLVGNKPQLNITTDDPAPKEKR